MDSEKYAVTLTDEAENDIDGILKYLTTEFDSKDAAKSFMSELNNCLEVLSHFPKAFPLCEGLGLSVRNYRKAKVKEYVLLYKFEDSSGEVFVMRVIYARRDYLNMI